MTTIKVKPTKKGNGLHVYIYHNSPPGMHKISLDFATALLLASHIYREGMRGLFSKNLESMEKWQIEFLRDAFEIFRLMNKSKSFKQYETELLGSGKSPIAISVEE